MEITTNKNRLKAMWRSFTTFIGREVTVALLAWLIILLWLAAMKIYGWEKP